MKKNIKFIKILIIGFVYLSITLYPVYGFANKAYALRIPIDAAKRIKEAENAIDARASRPIKIGMIHYSFNWPGGVDRIMRQHIYFFLKHEIAVDVLVGMSNMENEEGLNIERMKELWLNPSEDQYENYKKIILNKLRAWLKDKDVVILHNMLTLRHVNRPFYDAFKYLMETDKDIKAKVIAWTHDVEESVHIDVVPGVTYTAISTKTKTALQNALPGLKKDIPLTENVIDFTSLLDLSQNVKNFFIRHNLYDQDYVFIYPARLSPNKNIERAIRILKDIKDAKQKNVKEKGNKIKAKLIIVGSTRARMEYEAEYYSKLLNLIRELGLEKHVIFTGDEYDGGKPWQVSDQELSSLYKISSALLFTSRGEGFGLPVVEAAGLGLPVIALDIEPMRSLLMHQLRLPMEYSPQDARRIIKFLRKRNITKQAQHEAFRRFNIEFSWDNVLNILGLSFKIPVVGAQTSIYSRFTHTFKV